MSESISLWEYFNTPRSLYETDDEEEGIQFEENKTREIERPKRRSTSTCSTANPSTRTNSVCFDHKIKEEIEEDFEASFSESSYVPIRIQQSQRFILGDDFGSLSSIRVPSLRDVEIDSHAEPRDIPIPKEVMRKRFIRRISLILCSLFVAAISSSAIFMFIWAKNEVVELDELPSMASELRPAPAKLDEMCEMDRIRNGRSRNCEKACFAASCCWDTGGDCYQENTSACEGYSICKNLKMVKDTTEREFYIDPQLIKELVDETCGNDDIIDNPKLFNDCKNLCSSRLCCFEDDAKQHNCRDSKQNECHVFDSCRVISNLLDEPSTYVTETDYAISPELYKAMVEETCDINMFHVPEDFNNCKVMCASNMCCFSDGEDNCIHNRKRKYDCNVYDSCKILNDYEY